MSVLAVHSSTRALRGPGDTTITVGATAVEVLPYTQDRSYMALQIPAIPENAGRTGIWLVIGEPDLGGVGANKPARLKGLFLPVGSIYDMDSRSTSPSPIWAISDDGGPVIVTGLYNVYG